jgi:hypothetical protein
MWIIRLFKRLFGRNKRLGLKVAADHNLMNVVKHTTYD